MMERLAPKEDTTTDFTSQISDKLGSPITTGSFGVVYRCIAEPSVGKTEVAVKVFKIDSSRTMEKLKKAILRELEVWLKLKHPTIVPLLGTARVESPLLALVSQWMPSGTLSEYLDEKATIITTSARIELVKGVAEGLYYLHSENVIHGDLHPGNVLIDGSGNPCLTDFGLATVAEDPELQWTTTTVGRSLDPRWRAPEAIGIDNDPGRPTFKSDIYSFGSVMFFIVSGDIPWKEKKYSHQIIIELSKRATHARPYNISFNHWDLIQTCWSWEPGHRPEATRVLNLVQGMAENSQKMIDDSLHNRKWCYALLQAGRLAEAHEAYCYMMRDEATMVNSSDWFIAFEQESRALYTRNGDAALSSKDYDKAIELYSAAIDLNSASDTIFASRCSANLGKMLWEDALVDAQKVIELNSSSYIGYKLKNEALHGLQRYDEAIVALDIMLAKLDHVSDTHTHELRQQYVTSSEAASAIQNVIRAQLEDTPYRLINTITGRLCNQGEQIIAFKTSPEYKELLTLTMKHASADLRLEDITNVVEMYFRFVMLSHRWEENEPLHRHIQDKHVYNLDPIGGIMKLQSFCKIAHDYGYRWAWVDTCCIDQTNNVEVQQAVNSMFVWYRHSALTIVYLSDVPPSSKSGALAKSVWNQRGWTVQDFLAPKFILFYQSDWTLYLNDLSPNHKDSAVIMRELADATGIDPQALVAFRPGMSGVREKLQWVSMRVTTLPEDIAYSLFGIFCIQLPVIYGENKQNALGRLLQEIIALSGDITCLDWVGKPSEFNSCLPADITSYGTPPYALPPPLSEDEMEMSVSSLRDADGVELASKLYQTLNSLSAPQFVSRRLRLPCIAFAVTAVRRKRGEDQGSASTFGVKAAGLRDLSITTEDKLVPFSRARLSHQSFLLVRPWDRSLLELPNFEDLPDLSDVGSEEDCSPPVSPLDDSPVGSLGEHGPDYESYSRALRLIVRLGQPFSAFLLAKQRGGEYKRIASDQIIIAQVEDMTAVRDMMDVRTLEIL